MKAKTSGERPLLIRFSNPAAWRSCRIITPNLIEAYSRHFGSAVDIVTSPTPASGAEWSYLAQRIHALRPERIILVEHHPHPLPLIQRLSSLFAPAPIPPIYVHVYGDFTLNTTRWLELERTLRRTRVTWICASERQARLIGALVRGDRAIVQCPFPIDTPQFRFDRGVRRLARTQLGIPADETVFLYTGRLSMQKNIFRLMREFTLFLQCGQPRARLMLAGNFDDLGAPLFGARTPLGHTYAIWRQIMDGMEPRIREKICWLEFQETANLAKLYQAADVFVSLSIHHDEDFGMSPAEALCAGLPAILTDWGGYASLGSASAGSCDMVPVRILPNGIGLSSESILAAFRRHSSQVRDLAERERRSGIFSQDFSLSRAGERLEEIHRRRSERFLGFTHLMRRHARALDRAKPGGAPFPLGPRKRTLYEEVYRNYVEEAPR